MKIIYTKPFPPKGYLAIMLFGVVFAKRKLGEYLDPLPVLIVKLMISI